MNISMTHLRDILIRIRVLFPRGLLNSAARIYQYTYVIYTYSDVALFATGRHCETSKIIIGQMGWLGSPGC